MSLFSKIDWIIFFTTIVIVLAISIFVYKSAKNNTTHYFLSNRNMPWWLLGISMVATTFSIDTPNLVTNIVRLNGVSGNWQWWAFLWTGMLTVFIYARLWKKSRMFTDIAFYELRYGGASAVFLRGFRALYIGLVFNVLAMAAVNLAAIKMGQILLDLSPIQVLGISTVIIMFFSMLGGFKGIVYTDFFLFFIAITGAFLAAYYCVSLPEVGNLGELLTHPNVKEKLMLLPSLENKQVLFTLFIIPLAVQWWSSWYPGSEPGGGGYIAQRMIASKNDNHAIKATFFFNLMHYAIRPWPWIIVALCSLIVFPDLQSIQHAFPNIAVDKLGHDAGYPAMLSKLPKGVIGIVLASLMAAYISTISTHLNWGSSYLVNDFYKPFINKKASEKRLVYIGRLSTVILMLLSSAIALLINNALQIFNYIIMFGAGTGLIFILRWYWWRINAWSEISAMFISGFVSLIFQNKNTRLVLFGSEQESGIFPIWFDMPLAVIITTTGWLLVMLTTKPESKNVLINFYKVIQPEGIGWRRITKQLNPADLKLKKTYLKNGILCMILGSIFIYALLFFIGYSIYGATELQITSMLFAVVSGYFLITYWKKLL